MVIGLDDEGDIVEEQYTYTVELVSKARRIRYWRLFFAEKVSELWACLFAELEQESVEQTDSDTLTRVRSDDEMGQGESGKSSKVEPQSIKRSSWSLVEQESLTQDVKEYRRRRRKALLEALVDIRAGQCGLSRRVISIWAYQRRNLVYQQSWSDPLNQETEACRRNR